MSEIIVLDMNVKGRNQGLDFNTLLLKQNENKQLSKRTKKVRRFMVNLMLQMRRTAVLAEKVL